MITARSPFDDFKPLKPLEKMGKNEKCWCNSGRKWKNCHRNRSELKSLPLSAFHAKFYDEAKQTRVCSYPAAPVECSDTFSASHTIQKRTGLSELAENQHVLSARNRGTNEKLFTLGKIGINIASTFYGFCSKHDNNTFKPAEISTEPNEDVAFLLSYRALCYEIYMKKVAVQTFEYTRDHIDRGVDFLRQSHMQQTICAAIFSNSLGFREHVRLKRDWDSALVAGDRSSFKWASFQFDGLLPIATSGAFFPEFDFTGKQLQELDAPLGSLALLAFNILPIDGKATAIFGWLDNKEQNEIFVNSLKNVPDSHLSSTIIQFAFDVSDNLFVRPSWWEQINIEKKNYLVKNLRNSTPGEKWSKGLVPRDPPLSSLEVLSRR